MTLTRPLPSRAARRSVISIVVSPPPLSPRRKIIPLPSVLARNTTPSKAHAGEGAGWAGFSTVLWMPSYFK